MTIKRARNKKGKYEESLEKNMTVTKGAFTSIYLLYSLFPFVPTLFCANITYHSELNEESD